MTYPLSFALALSKVYAACEGNNLSSGVEGHASCRQLDRSVTRTQDGVNSVNGLPDGLDSEYQASPAQFNSSVPSLSPAEGEATEGNGDGAESFEVPTTSTQTIQCPREDWEL